MQRGYSLGRCPLIGMVPDYPVRHLLPALVNRGIPATVTPPFPNIPLGSARSGWVAIPARYRPIVMPLMERSDFTGFGRVAWRTVDYYCDNSLRTMVCLDDRRHRLSITTPLYTGINPDVTLLEPQSRFGDILTLFWFQVICPQNGTAVPRFTNVLRLSWVCPSH